MKTKLSALAAIAVAVAMFALPVRALARDHDGDDPYHQNHGHHNGWNKHHRDADDYAVQPYYQYQYRPLQNPSPRYYREPDRDDFRYNCDGDGDNCRPNPRFFQPPVYQPRYDADDYRYNCDQDGDNCGPNQPYAPSPVYYPPVAVPQFPQAAPGLFGNPILIQQRNALIGQWNTARANYLNTVRNNNVAGQRYWLSRVNQLSNQIAALNAPANVNPYGAAYPSSFAAYPSTYAPASYYGGYGTGYGNGLDTAVTTLMPLLQQYMTH